MLKECLTECRNQNKNQEGKYERIIPIYCDEGEKMLRRKMLEGMERQKIGVVRVYFQKPPLPDCLQVKNFYIRPLSPHMTMKDVKTFIEEAQRGFVLKSSEKHKIRNKYSLKKAVSGR